MSLVNERIVFVLGSFVAACSASVARLPGPGETVAARDFVLEAGGKGLNVAIGLRRLGLRVEGLIAAGDDLFGTLAAEALARADLPAAMLRRLPGRSGAGMGLIDGAGETVIAVDPGANALLATEHVAAAAAALRRAAYVVAQFEVADAAVAAAFAMAGPGAKRVLNPSPFRPIDPAILARTDILVVNLAEARALAGAWRIAVPAAGTTAAVLAPLAVAAHRAGVAMLIVTRGASDALLWQTGDPVRVQPSFPAASIDGIGAGDGFLAGLIAALARGEPVATALREAAAAGALVTTRRGVAAALPTRAEIAELLRSHEAS